MWPRYILGRVFQCPRNQSSLCPGNNEVPSPPQTLGLWLPEAIHNMESPMNGSCVCLRVCVCVYVHCVCWCGDDGTLFPQHLFNTALSCSPIEISGSLVLVHIFTVGNVCVCVWVCVCPLINSPASEIILITRAGQRGFKATHWADWTD